jgi:hypothetical protein
MEQSKLVAAQHVPWVKGNSSARPPAQALIDPRAASTLRYRARELPVVAGCKGSEAPARQTGAIGQDRTVGSQKRMLQTGH